MYIIHVKQPGLHISYKFKNCITPYKFKFKEYDAMIDFLGYLQDNNITDYTAEQTKRYPMVKKDTGPNISLSTTIGGRP